MRRLIACLMAWNPIALRQQIREMEDEAERLSSLLVSAARRIELLKSENRQLALMRDTYAEAHHRQMKET